MELAPNLQYCAASNPILITGHTGFKGTWLALLLKNLGIPTIGLALEPKPESLYSKIPTLGFQKEYFEDIRDFSAVSRVIHEHNPSIIFHLAAQPLVIESYRTPRETFETNVMGTVNLLEAFRNSKNARIFAGITTDKVYRNLETARRFQESDPLSGKDPYSASKVGTESALAAWRHVSSVTQGPQVLSLRAGNVIGGGDYADNRIIPDIVRGLQSGEAIHIRNPKSTRPWQHVLDPLRGYLMASEFALSKGGINEFNFGPNGNSLSVKQLVEEGKSVWASRVPQILYEEGDVGLEAATLQLDSSVSKKILGWKPMWSQKQAIRDTFNWWNDVIHKQISAEQACLRDIEHIFKKETS